MISINVSCDSLITCRHSLYPFSSLGKSGNDCMRMRKYNTVGDMDIASSRCHVKMGTPYFGDPGSPYSYENGDPDPFNS